MKLFDPVRIRVRVSWGAYKEKVIPIRWIAEQHVMEDLGQIPTAADWLRHVEFQPWMNRARKLSQEQENGSR